MKFSILAIVSALAVTAFAQNYLETSVITSKEKLYIKFLPETAVNVRDIEQALLRLHHPGNITTVAGGFVEATRHGAALIKIWDDRKTVIPNKELIDWVQIGVKHSVAKTPGKAGFRIGGEVGKTPQVFVGKK